MENIWFLVGAIVLTIVVSGAYWYFITKPRQLKRYYDANRYLLLRWKYEGGIKQKRKLLITLDRGGKTKLKIGFTQFGGYFFYGIFWTNKEGVAVIETFLGDGDCDFVVITDSEDGIIGRIKLLPEDDNRAVTETYHGHFWQ